MKKRLLAFMLALALFVLTPVSDYFGARDTYAVGVLTAAQYVWVNLFASVGVKVLTGDAIDSVVADLGEYLQGSDNPYWTVYTSVASATWDSVLNLGSSVFDMLKDYFSSKDGYGSDIGMDSLVTSAIRSPDSYFVYNGSKFRIRGSVYGYVELSGESDIFVLPVKHYTSDGISYQHGFACVSSGSFSVLQSLSTDKKVVYQNGIYAYYKAGYEMMGYSSAVYAKDDYKYTFSSQTETYKWFESLDETYLGAGSIALPVSSAPDIQARPVTGDGILALPLEDASQALLDAVFGADTAEDMADALAGTLDVTYGDTVDEDEDTNVYPWLPDITGLLDGIKDGIGSVGDGVGALTDALGNLIGDIADGFSGVISSVTAIPASIADAFSATDTTAVSQYTIADLKSLFPFCIPFDLIDFLGVLSAEPEAPKFIWTFPGVSRYGIPEVDVVIDLSVFNTVASIVRTLETLGFIVGLALITRSHMIRG